MTRPQIRLIVAAVAFVLASASHAALAQPGPPSGTAPPLSSAFTYQGRLMDGARPADGSYAMIFRLFDAESGGAQIGPPLSQTVAVAGGLFTARLDFGPGAFAGAARWLAVEVGGTILSPRQALTAAPAATYASAAPWAGLLDVPPDLADGDDVGLTSVGWTDVLSRPAGLDDGDDVGLTSVGWTDVLSRPAGLDDGDNDTRYSAGAGLNLANNQFSVNTGAIQARVGGGCAAGSSIRSIAADGAVACALAEPRPRFASTHVDDPGIFEGAGYNTMIAIGADGLPFIAYRASYQYFEGTAFVTTYSLRAAHCDDTACSTARVTTLAGGLGTFVVGPAVSLAIGADRLPVISFFDETNSDLLVAHCSNPECTASTVSRLESGRMAGSYNAIMVNGDGLPLIGYYDQTDTSLKLARCGDFSCTSVTTSTLDNSGDTGKHISLGQGADGLPIIAYYDQTNTSLRAAHCATIQCDTFTMSTLDNSADVGLFTSLAIGADGLPLISYLAGSTADLKLARCADLSCAGATLTVVDSGSIGQYSSLAIDPAGLPIISYYNTGVRDLMVAHCQNPACSAVTKIAADTGGTTGSDSSITIGADGLPIISYHYAGGSLLKVIHCGNRFCAPFGGPR